MVLSSKFHRDFAHGQQQILQLSKPKFANVKLEVQSPLQVQRQLRQANPLSIFGAELNDALLSLVELLLQLRFLLALALPLCSNALLLLYF